MTRQASPDISTAAPMAKGSNSTIHTKGRSVKNKRADRARASIYSCLLAGLGTSGKLQDTGERLATQTKPLQDLAIANLVLMAEIVQMTPTLADQLEQATS